jgi:hypothetical protein
MADADAPLTASSRAEAKSLGLKRYSTGAPCAQGHVADRFTSSGQCVECAKAKGSAPDSNPAEGKPPMDDTAGASGAPNTTGAAPATPPVEPKPAEPAVEKTPEATAEPVKTPTAGQAETPPVKPETPAAPPANEPEAPVEPAKVPEPDPNEKVDVWVPKDFTILVDNAHYRPLKAGKRQLTRAQLADWWVVANGVKEIK